NGELRTSARLPATLTWWRGWDSNPRYGETVNQISSLAHSTTLPPLRSGASAGRCRGRDSRACVDRAPSCGRVERDAGEARIAEARLPALSRRHRRGVGDRSRRDDVAGDDRPPLGPCRHRIDPQLESMHRSVEDDVCAALLDVATVADQGDTQRRQLRREVARTTADETIDRQARADEQAP